MHEVPLPPLTVIICARNEAHNLKRFLPSILQQNYPNFEILLVDDGSSDDTQSVLKTFQEQFAHFRVHYISSEAKGKREGKKYALAQGIALAKNDFILLTDADCEANSLFWAKKMMQTLIHNKSEIVLGYSPYRAEPSSVNAFIQFETLTTALQYCSFALRGIPYMGVGRNMLYNKELFARAGGFAKHEHVASGDDDLFVNAVASQKNTSICLEAATFMVSVPKSTWRAYFRQKQRHVSTAAHYSLSHQILLMLLAASHALHYLLGIYLIAKQVNANIVIFVLIVFLLLKLFFYAKLEKLLHGKSPVWELLLLDVLFILYYFMLLPAILFTKKLKWS